MQFLGKLWDKFVALGRKFVGASFASVLLFIALVFVGLSGKGADLYPEFVMGVVTMYMAFAGSNVGATYAGAKAALAGKIAAATKKKEEDE